MRAVNAPVSHYLTLTGRWRRQRRGLCVSLRALLRVCIFGVRYLAIERLLQSAHAVLSPCAYRISTKGVAGGTWRAALPCLLRYVARLLLSSKHGQSMSSIISSSLTHSMRELEKGTASVVDEWWTNSSTIMYLLTTASRQANYWTTGRTVRSRMNLWRLIFRWTQPSQHKLEKTHEPIDITRSTAGTTHEPHLKSSSYIWHNHLYKTNVYQHTYFQ